MTNIVTPSGLSRQNNTSVTELESQMLCEDDLREINIEGMQAMKRNQQVTIEQRR